MGRDYDRNVGDAVAARIEHAITSAANDASMFQDNASQNVRAGWQQRYGGIQMENVVDDDYAMFGSVWNSSSTVAR
jgi:hypothetical protein